MSQESDAGSKQAGGEKLITSNRKAHHDYHILETMEAGLVLQGTEVKSLRAGRANLKDSWVDIRDGQMFLVGMHISPYEAANRFNHAPERERKLLMHRREITRIAQKAREKSLTVVPLKLYFKNGKAKAQIAMVKGKRAYDKRDAMAERDNKREVDRALKEGRRE